MEALTPLNLGFGLLAGGLTTLSPCVLPLLPLVVGGAMQKNSHAPIYMGLGMVLSFMVIGIVIGQAGASLGLDPDTVRIAGAVLLVLFGIAMLLPSLGGWLTRRLEFLSSGANNLASGLDESRPTGALLLGALLGLVWSPCSGPLLGSTLTLVASQGGAVPGGVLLGVFGLGAALPLVAVGYLSRGALAGTRDWMLKHGNTVKKVFGVFILLIGLAILSGADKWLETQVLDVLPDSWLSLVTHY